MKSYKFMLIATAIITGSLQLFAQDQTEALKFSQRFLQSDARAMGSGNAYGAIGASLISSSINPGSLALYKKSEFSFSLGFLNVNSTGNYLGVSSTDHRNGLNLPQVGMAITKINYQNGKPVTDGWVSYTFSGAINRTNSFQANKYFEGLNTKSSVLYNYAETANGIESQNLSLNNLGGLAWDTYLINKNDKTANSYVPIDTLSRDFFQQNSVRTTGNSYDINIAAAGNYSDKIFIGAAISFPRINYNEKRNFTETNMKPYLDSSYISSNYYRELDINGNGVQASFGIIIKPIKYIRFGVSIQSPTFYSLHANYNQEMNSSVLRTSLFGDTSWKQSSSGEMDFSFTSPFRATGSLAIIAGKYGFLSVDYEFIDYSQGYYSSNTDPYTSSNKKIESYYTNASNLRIGGELKLDIFALRAGYGIYGSPYKNQSDVPGGDASAATLSFGVGLREDNYFIDFAFQQIKSKEYYLPYSLDKSTMEKYDVSEVAGNIYDIKRSTFLLTMGVKF
jgi:hypothetical protein